MFHYSAPDGVVPSSVAPEGALLVADLFAGIGGIRLGFEQAAKKANVKMHTIFANDFDPKCKMTYDANFGRGAMTGGSIADIASESIPKFDVLLAGFPCQAFSIAGSRQGFDDIRGTLFFEIVRILKSHNPRCFLLENVEALARHDKGRTLSVMLSTLREKLGYNVSTKVLNSRHFGLPQNRDRLYIVGFNGDYEGDLYFPEGNTETPMLASILEEEPAERLYLSQTYYEGITERTRRNAAKGNGYGMKRIYKYGIARTLLCGGMGLERNLVVDEVVNPWSEGKDKMRYKNPEGLRRLSVRECARLQGFPDSYKFGVATTQAYKQVANSVSVPVIAAIAERMLERI